jgi:hypothetical protein
MASLVARITIPTVKGGVLSMCGRTARLGGVIGATGLFGAHVLSTQPLFVKSQCQGFQWGGKSWLVGGVAPRHQFTQSDFSLQRSRAPIDFQQLSSGSVLGIITGYLTAKIGRLFLFSFGGLILFGAVRDCKLNLSSFFDIRDIFRRRGHYWNEHYMSIQTTLTETNYPHSWRKIPLSRSSFSNSVDDRHPLQQLSWSGCYTHRTIKVWLQLIPSVTEHDYYVLGQPSESTTPINPIQESFLMHSQQYSNPASAATPFPLSDPTPPNHQPPIPTGETWA